MVWILTEDTALGEWSTGVTVAGTLRGAVGAEHAVGDRVDGAPGGLAGGLGDHLEGRLLQLRWERASRAETAPAGHLDGRAVSDQAGGERDDGGVGARAEGSRQDDGRHIVVNGAARVLRVLGHLLGAQGRAYGAVQGVVADGEDARVARLTVHAVG